MERDVLKRWQKNGKIIAEFGIENQTNQFSKMPLRLYGYNGTRYKLQLQKHAQKEKYPVISFVLNYDKSQWTGPKCLHDALCLDEKLRKLTPNIELIVIDMRYLTEETINLLNSDLKVIAKVLRCIRLKERYKEAQEIVDHSEEVAGLLSAVTEDKNFKELYKQVLEKKGDEYNMCEWLQQYFDDGEKVGYSKGQQVGYSKGQQAGYSKGQQAGYSKGVEKGKFQTILELYREKEISLLIAASKLGLSEEEFLLKEQEEYH